MVSIADAAGNIVDSTRDPGFATVAGQRHFEQQRQGDDFLISEPQPVTVYRNKKAVVVTAKLTIPVTEKDNCAAPSVTVAVMMMENSKPDDVENVTLVAMGDQDVPEATPEGDLTRIVTSLHLIT